MLKKVKFPEKGKAVLFLISKMVKSFKIFTLITVFWCKGCNIRLAFVYEKMLMKNNQENLAIKMLLINF